MNVGVIVLAAGSSSRMGQPKQLLPVDGQPLLIRTTEVALGSEANQVIVVLGSEAETCFAILEKLPVHIVVNNNWNAGIGSSIKEGLKKLIELQPAVDGAIILASDQPEVTSAHLNHLIASFVKRGGDKTIVASFYQNTPGIPVLFSSAEFNALLSAIKDHEGAKRYIEQYPQKTINVSFPQGAIDLDTPDDYKAYTASPN